nr:hypothetical protein [Synechococcus sp. KORDI-52]
MTCPGDVHKREKQAIEISHGLFRGDVEKHRKPLPSGQAFEINLHPLGSQQEHRQPHQLELTKSSCPFSQEHRPEHPLKHRQPSFLPSKNCCPLALIHAHQRARLWSLWSGNGDHGRDSLVGACGLFAHENADSWGMGAGLSPRDCSHTQASHGFRGDISQRTHSDSTFLPENNPCAPTLALATKKSTRLLAGVPPLFSSLTRSSVSRDYSAPNDSLKYA